MKFFYFDVTIYMNSGATVTGKVTKLNKTYHRGALATLDWEGNMPFYFKLDEVDAITYKKRINWCNLFRKMK